MRSHDDKAAPVARLRRSAEQQLKAKAAATVLPQTEADTLKLLHELRVHQIELELQNEELRRSHEELEASREKYSLLYDFAPVGYFTLTRDGTICKANLTGSSLLGQERSRLVKRRFGMFVDDQYRQGFAGFLVKVFANRETQTCELLLAPEAGPPLFVQIEATGAAAGAECFVAVINISVRKRLEAALALSREDLEQRIVDRTAELACSVGLQNEEMAGRLQAVEELRKNELLLIRQNRMAALGEMLGYIAHQWRQPLNVLGLKVQELGLSYELGGFSKELLDNNIARTMEILTQLSQTIDDFREFSSPDKEKSLFRVDLVAAKTVALLRDNFTELGIAIEVSSSGEPQVNGYPNEYGQVVLNVLVNAKDAFAGKQTSAALITVRSRREDGRAVLTITDNAGGIDEKIMDKIFDPYFTTKELGKGTGVGLFMSKTIIEKNMGGRFSARNVENGAEFRIEV